VRECVLRMIQSFEQFIQDNKDEIEVLQILYSKPYAAGLSLKQVMVTAYDRPISRHYQSAGSVTFPPGP
jgi:hypothetical protein